MFVLVAAWEIHFKCVLTHVCVYVCVLVCVFECVRACMCMCACVHACVHACKWADMIWKMPCVKSQLTFLSFLLFSGERANTEGSQCDCQTIAAGPAGGDSCLPQVQQLPRQLFRPPGNCQAATV